MIRDANDLSRLSRPKKLAIQLIVDATLVFLSFVAAMWFRLESVAFALKLEIWSALFITSVIAFLTFSYLGLYRVLVRFLTGKILIPVGKGALVAAVALYFTGLFLDAGIPRSVPVIFGLFVFLSLSGIRFMARTVFRNPAHLVKRPVIIFGAGESGLQLLNSLFHGREYAPVALVDDDPDLQNRSVGGLRVYAPEQIRQLVATTGAHVVLMAIPSISRLRRREIVDALEDLQIDIKAIPGPSEIISGKAKISELRTITAEDLLGRDPVAPDPQLLSTNITGLVVMVSGAGGSIGSELCRQILGQEPKVLVLFEISEFALYTIEAELSATASRLKLPTKIVAVLGSVQSGRRLEETIKVFGVQTIYHAAAYKHVPLVEENVGEAALNNVFGTLAITSAAKELSVKNFILISTDKAVRPTNVMGATKRIAELICQAHAQEVSHTTFSMVRFGNVLGSSGSVIPRFRAQIESGGPVTVTHEDVTRYFMTIPEASQLVIQAGAMAKGGDVFVLEMGDPVKILDVAIEMVKLHGLVPYLTDNPDQIAPENGDIPIFITGLRKGEKLYEELLIGKNSSPTLHPRIMTASEVSLSKDMLMPVLDRLHQACESVDTPSIIAILQELPLDYTPTDEMTPSWSTDLADERQKDAKMEETLTNDRGVL